MHERHAILALWNAVSERNGSAALATVVEVKGSAYRRAGARMILTRDGQSAGILNGGCLDADLWMRARQVMESGHAQLAIYDTTSNQDIVFGLGLGCRGVVKILIEPIRDLSWLRDNAVAIATFENKFTVSDESAVSDVAGVSDESAVSDVAGVEGELGTRAGDADWSGRPQIIASATGRAFIEKLEAPQPLIIFGAGADAVPLAQMGELLGWDVQIVDPRAPHAERPVHLESRFVAPENLGELEIAPRAACVLMTHNFLHDLEILKFLLPSSAYYVGVLGPRRRANELLEKLGQATLSAPFAPTPEQLVKLYAPVGLDLGAETPAEIALAIVAEIQKLRRAKSGASLREMTAIH